MNEQTTLTHALHPGEKQNKVELRRSLRRSMRGEEIKIPLFGSRLEIALFGLAAIALLATPMIRASVKAKEDLVEIASRFRIPSNVDDTIITGTVTKPRIAAPAARPATPEKPALRGSL